MQIKEVNELVATVAEVQAEQQEHKELKRKKKEEETAAKKQRLMEKDEKEEKRKEETKEEVKKLISEWMTIATEEDTTRDRLIIAVNKSKAPILRDILVWEFGLKKSDVAQAKCGKSEIVAKIVDQISIKAATSTEVQAAQIEEGETTSI